MIDPQHLKTAVALIGRADLKGNEALQAAACLQALIKLHDSLVQPAAFEETDDDTPTD